METGPLVVLEAYAFGLPVMGADLGGIAERIRDGVDGWLLPFDDSRAWAAAMREVALDRTKLRRLAGNVLPSRTMADVASEMAEVYRQVLDGRKSPVAGRTGAG
jgi:glycosyltransferase involved in cell wall biosynthesis